METKNYEDYSHLIIKMVQELGISIKSIEATIKLLSEGNTIPFISRYRKELTGSLDEDQVEKIEKRFDELVAIEERRIFILKSINDQDKMTPELEAKINAAQTLSELEDLYLPYKPRKRTKAQIGREKGLEEPALKIMSGELKLRKELEAFIDEEKDLPDVEAVELWIGYIIAEDIAHNSEVRADIRETFWDTGQLTFEETSEPDDETGKFKDLIGGSYKLEEIPGHRILAGNRGEKADAINVKLLVSEEGACEKIEERFLAPVAPEFKFLVTETINDAYNRLIYPSLVTETRNYLTEDADTEAIEVFSENLQPILLASPLGGKAVLGIDPGYRTGCKVAAVSGTGAFLNDTVIYPTAPRLDIEGANAIVENFLKRFNIHFVAVGNGTASRETEDFLRKLQKSIKDWQFEVIVVAETGASVYSASKIAREEFPGLDLTVRGAISIARRLQDPLAELVKIDPKSIGVGQYQHDVNQKKLKAALDRVVEHCVNLVGVDLNTASYALLSYVSGLNLKIAKNIVDYRVAEGFFKNRKQLKKVKALGAKTFEQCAGFLRIREGDNILDNTAVHPESYAIVGEMAKKLEISLTELPGNNENIGKLKPKDFVNEEKGIGLPTILDIIEELKKPGRDPRGEFEVFKFGDVEEISDLEEEMELPGIVTNVTRFGAFVDVGVHQDGLVHVSELADFFVQDPSEVVTVGQKVNVKVMTVEVKRKRIALSMKNLAQP